MKSNQEIIQNIRSFEKNMKKFDFSPTQKLSEFRLLPSAQDRYGVVIMKDEKIYRGIYSNSKDMFIRLYNTGILQILMQEQLVPKWSVSNYYTDDYPILLEVEKLNIINARDYTYSMIREEAKLKLCLLEILSEFGYTLIDGHTANTTFKNGRALFFDLGSFIPSATRGADREIWMYDIIPLIFLSCGKFMSARGIYHGLPNPWLVPFVSLDKSNEVKATIDEFLTLFHFDTGLQDKIKNFKPLASTELDILFPPEHYAMNVPDRTNYMYLQDIKNTCDDTSAKVIEKIFTTLPNTKLIHLGCSTGWFETKCVQSNNFKSVYGLDCNEFLLEYAVNNIDGADFLLCNAIIGGPVIIPDAEVVYTSGMVYDLLIKKRFDITTVLTCIKKYVHKYLYIEFFPYGKLDIGNTQETMPDWYCTEWFEKHLGKFFNITNKEILEAKEINGVQKPYRILYIAKTI